MPIFNTTRKMASSGPQETAHTSWPIDQRIDCVQHDQKHGFFKRLREDFWKSLKPRKLHQFQ